ncbi:MAG TPA: M18 family aminopeptidase [Nitrococcus sp.]|nr:M18 family aminopeptidase [Nitrococcus sp.]
MQSPQEREPARRLLGFIDDSPSPWHAAERMAGALAAAGFVALRETQPWKLQPGMGYYVIRGGSSIIAFRLGARPLQGTGLRIAAAHTDSPGLRIKPAGESIRGAMAMLGVEVYGGPILASFADRDLTLAGRVLMHTGSGLEERLYRHPTALVRLPNLAIHMNRTVNDEGLRFDLQEQLPLILEYSEASQAPTESRFRERLAGWLDIPLQSLKSWELAVADTQPGAFFGPAEEFIAASRLDNLASCHAALEALLAVEPVSGLALIACFDHEEVGSGSYHGAAGSFLPDTLAAIAASLGADAMDLRRELASGWLVSADMAHAYHPNFPAYYDEANAPRVNAGPVIKLNAKQRYATDAVGDAYFQALCEQAGVPWQRYVHRTNLPCGSTIGPICATRLGLRTVDVGAPMWSMHSIRESAGAFDHGHMIRALSAFFAEV